MSTRLKIPEPQHIYTPSRNDPYQTQVYDYFHSKSLKLTELS